MRWNLLSRSRRPTLAPADWTRALEYSRYARALAAAERRRLRALVEAFLRAKTFDGPAGFSPTATMRAVVALKACLPVLHLGLEWYDEWSEIVVYPGDFRVQDEFTDEIGVVHRETRDLCGQSMDRGPMVLSWQSIEDERAAPDRDVVIHECAHKLDILNGDANGFPPLHSGISAAAWTGAFAPAFERFVAAVDSGADTALDPYAATDPAEFFAVTSETFFTEPGIVHADFPAVYAQLAAWYRQDPLARLGSAR